MANDCQCKRSLTDPHYIHSFNPKVEEELREFGPIRKSSFSTTTYWYRIEYFQNCRDRILWKIMYKFNIATDYYFDKLYIFR